MQNLIWKVTIFVLWPFFLCLGLVLLFIAGVILWPLIFFAEILFDDFAELFDRK